MLAHRSPPSLKTYYDQLTGYAAVDAGDGFINSLSVDGVSNEYLLCGAADSSMSIWNINGLDQGKTEPMARVDRKVGHEFGVSKIAWWPLDNGMFVSGSFDTTVKMWDTENLETVYTFELEQKVYNFDIKATGGNSLVAAGLDHPFIRLLDLNSASSAQSLQGHAGKVLSVKWSPVNEYLLASAGSDGTVRVWDIRQARSMVSSMDMMRAAGQDLTPLSYRKAHRGSVNGLCWSHKGDELISLGNDNKARLWDLTEPGGVNESVNYGPLVQNRYLQTLDPVLSPPGDTDFPYIFIPSDTGDILLLQLDDGKLVKRLTPPVGSKHTRQACVTPRGEGYVQYFSGDGNGRIVNWTPKTTKEPPVDTEQPKTVEYSDEPATIGDFLN